MFQSTRNDLQFPFRDAATPSNTPEVKTMAECRGSLGISHGDPWELAQNGMAYDGLRLDGPNNGPDSVRGGVWSEAAERQQQQKTRRFPRPMMSARWKSSENLNLTTCHHNITTIGCVRMGAATFHSTLATMIVECYRL